MCLQCGPEVKNLKHSCNLPPSLSPSIKTYSQGHLESSHPSQSDSCPHYFCPIDAWLWPTVAQSSWMRWSKLCLQSSEGSVKKTKTQKRTLMGHARVHGMGALMFMWIHIVRSQTLFHTRNTEHSRRTDQCADRTCAKTTTSGCGAESPGRPRKSGWFHWFKSLCVPPPRGQVHLMWSASLSSHWHASPAAAPHRLHVAAQPTVSHWMRERNIHYTDPTPESSI